MLVDVRGTDLSAVAKALAELKNKMKKADVLMDLRKHEGYLKPSLKRKLKRLEAQKRRRRDEQAARKRRRLGV